jgi:hypothetical protein
MQSMIPSTMLAKSTTSSLPSDNMYIDTLVNGFFGKPVTAAVYNMVLTGTDYFSYAYIPYTLIVSSKPYFASTTICDPLLSISITKPQSSILIYSYNECLLDATYTLTYWAL